MPMPSLEPHPFTLYGWHLSYFAGKLRCYLQHKRIPFTDQAVNLPTLMWRIPRKTGVRVMPVLRSPAGEWLQDTSEIIDRLEREFPERPVLPETPWQRWLCHLLEAWGDEWWMPIAMHTRWSYPENYPLFERDAGSALLPGFPRFLQARAVAHVAGYLRGALPAVGIRPENYAVLETWAHAMMAKLDAHFAAHSYLLGGRPTLADFSLMGTMYGHLGRDPWPRREMVGRYPHLRAWIDRMATPTDARFGPNGAAPSRSSDRYGPLFAGDEIPPTLVPIVQQVVGECLPWFDAIAGEVQRVVQKNPGRFPPGRRLPRVLGDVALRTAEGTFHRAAMPYTLWMAQRAQHAFRDLDATGQARVRGQLRALGSADTEALLDRAWPALARHGLGATLAAP